MESIMHLAHSEAMLFKYGSGTGTDLTPIRSSKEKLSGGGRPSGPLSFLKVYDQVANVVKSGGKTRRAAKMNTLRDWHGDIEEFIDAKLIEEKKAWALIEQGYDGSYNGDAYGSVMYQNENLSVRVSDPFMQAALEGKEWWTRRVTDGSPLQKKDAAALLRKIAEGAWTCGDPGMQYDGAIQKWHTCKSTEPIHSTNPCSEYVFLNNTACNLASLNLMKFKREDGGFDIERFKAAVRIFITAQEIIVDNASYPTKEIAENSHIFRTLGLGYANLGSLIMSYGLPYDSDEGRALAGAVTAILTGHAYEQSAQIASVLGPFPGYRDARCAHVPKPLGRRQRRLHPGRDPIASPGGRRTFSPATNSPSSRTRRARPGTAPWRAGGNPATATPRSPCWPPPAPSPSSWTATPPGSSRTSRLSSINCSPAAASSRSSTAASPTPSAASITPSRKSPPSSPTSPSSTPSRMSRKTASSSPPA